MGACDPHQSQSHDEPLNVFFEAAHEMEKSDSPWHVGAPRVSSAMDWANDPDEITQVEERRLPLLPLAGKAEHIPWSDTYWPKYKGGIGQRWSTPDMTREPPTSPSEALSWTQEELSGLSPSEKYDLYVGNYNYSLSNVTESANRPDTAEWQGYCHGWAMAAIHFKEPSPVTLTNPDGVAIPFGSSDIKALLTFYQGEVTRSEFGTSVLPFTTDVKSGGGVCISNKPMDTNCSDSNPAMFHLVMTNHLGIHGRAFGIDATVTREKWNQPVYAYESHLLGEREPREVALPEAVKEVLVRSEVTYTMEIEPQWQPVLSTEHQHQVTKTYTYTLELNAHDEIIGGQWVLFLDFDHTPTLEQAWTFLTNADDDEDGIADHDEAESISIMWAAFDFPDYVWFQERAPFAETFKPAWNAYAFLSNNASSRKDLWHYFAHLNDIYEASIALPEVENEGL